MNLQNFKKLSTINIIIIFLLMVSIFKDITIDLFKKTFLEDPSIFYYLEFKFDEHEDAYEEKCKKIEVLSCGLQITSCQSGNNFSCVSEVSWMKLKKINKKKPLKFMNLNYR